ncbi:hypothetical protein ES708_32545 [subsurface metagenome]
MEKIVVSKKYRFKKDWSKNYNPIFYSYEDRLNAEKSDIVIFLGKSLGYGKFRNLNNETIIWMAYKEIFKILEEIKS